MTDPYVIYPAGYGTHNQQWLARLANERKAVTVVTCPNMVDPQNWELENDGC